jgi:hypothetical protein
MRTPSYKKKAGHCVLEDGRRIIRISVKAVRVSNGRCGPKRYIHGDIVDMYADIITVSRSFARFKRCV